MNEWIDLLLGQGKEVEELLILVLVASLIGEYFCLEAVGAKNLQDCKVMWGGGHKESEPWSPA